MSLQPAGQRAVQDALSGHVGLLSGDHEAAGIAREPVSLAHPRELVFGPVRSPIEATGIALFQSGVRILSCQLDEPRKLAAGQSLRLSMTLDASVD